MNKLIFEGKDTYRIFKLLYSSIQVKFDLKQYVMSKKPFMSDYTKSSHLTVTNQSEQVLYVF